MKQYATGDKTLNQHVFGNLKLKPVDFTSPEVYKMLKVKHPKGKKEIYEY